MELKDYTIKELKEEIKRRTELETFDQVDEAKHWQAVRERAAIAAMQSILSNSNILIYKITFNDTAKYAISFADTLVKQLKGE